MDESKENLSKVLHIDGKLPSLRTYQGDVASFIKSKDKSVAEIALKSKEEEKERRKKEEEGIRKNFFAPVMTPEQVKQIHQKEEDEKVKQMIKVKESEEKEKQSNSTNFLIYFLGVFLLVATIGVGFYVFIAKFKTESSAPSFERIKLIRSDREISIDASSLNLKSFEESVRSAKGNTQYAKGTTVFQISGLTSSESEDFVKKMNWNIPAPMIRSFYPELVAGLWGGDIESPQFFVIFKVKDYGIAFRDMLLWEETIYFDFGSLLNNTEISGYVWKDLIVKNKDARALVSPAGKVAVIYTFINQNTILITESEVAMTALVNSYVTGSSVR